MGNALKMLGAVLCSIPLFMILSSNIFTATGEIWDYWNGTVIAIPDNGGVLKTMVEYL